MRRLDRLTELRLMEMRLSKYGKLQQRMRKATGAAKAPKPKFKVDDVVVVDGLKTPGKIWRVNSYDDHLGDRTYSIRFVKGEHASSQTFNEKSLRMATKAEKAAMESVDEDQMGRAIFVGAPKVAMKPVGKLLSYEIVSAIKKGSKISYVDKHTKERWELTVTNINSHPHAYKGPTVVLRAIGKVVSPPTSDYGYVSRDRFYDLDLVKGKAPKLYVAPDPGKAGRLVPADVQKGTLRLEHLAVLDGVLTEGKYHEVHAFTMSRHRGRGGQTETVFAIDDPENPGNHEYTGRGAHPAERRADALKQHAAKFGITKPIKNVNFRERARKQAIKGVTQAARSGNKAKTTPIKIATMGGVKEVQAIVLGEYAYYKDPGHGYVVSHVPSGFRLVADLSKSHASKLMRRLHKQLPHPLPGAQFGKRPTDRGQLDRLKKALEPSLESVFSDDARGHLLARAS